jgi:hypothetical protein
MGSWRIAASLFAGVLILRHLADSATRILVTIAVSAPPEFCGAAASHISI